MHKHSVFLCLACLVSLSACAHPRAIVLSPSAPEGVRVRGEGEASAAPDIARTQVGVDVRALTPGPSEPTLEAASLPLPGHGQTAARATDIQTTPGHP